MLLDKIKTAALSVGLAAVAAIICAALGVKLIGALHAAPVVEVLRFISAQPIGQWPLDLIALAFAVIVVFLGIAAALWFLLKDMRWTHGPRSISSEDAAADLVAKSATGKPRIFAGKYDGTPLYVGAEDRALVIGPPGTGKTAFLLNQLLKATKDRLSFAVIDFKPEIYSIIGAALAERGYRVLRINPTGEDAEADHWNPLDEINTESGIVEICAALLPIRDAREAPFIEAQRDWLKAAVFHIKTKPGGNLPAAYELMTSQSDPALLLDIFSCSTSDPCKRIARRIAAGLAGSKPDPLIIQGLSGASRSLEFLSLQSVKDALGHSDFSIRDELGKGERPTALFIQFRETEAETFGQVLSLLATRLLSTLIETAGDRKSVAIFLDELGAIPPIPGLATKLNTIRSRHMPTWMYFQAVKQLEKQYGNGAASLFFTSADIQICFRLNDAETRETFSKLIGTTERQKVSQSTSTDGRGKSTITKTKEKVAVIEPHQLGQLEPGQVVCLYRGAAAKGRATPHFTDFPEFRRK